ncbi:MAG: hypothetical protein MK179_12970 [Pirellulaceae bacterium]|nr:hypothetical protein [Pirellulaceae bacterium]
MTFVPTLPVGDPISFSWKSDQSGDWQQSGNWDPVGMPNAVNHSATFGDVISTTQTVFTNIPVSVREVQFDSVQGYVVVGAGTILVSQGTSSATTISALQGTNQFQAAVKLLTNTSVDVSGAAAVIFDNALDVNGNRLTNSGEGTLVINNQLFMGGCRGGRWSCRGSRNDPGRCEKQRRNVSSWKSRGEHW